MHDPETSPVGRLDEYIRSFEKKYGAVPVEIQAHDLQSSIGSFVEPVAVRQSREERDPGDGLLDGLTSPARELCSLPASMTTPRYPWQVTPSEPVRALPFKLRSPEKDVFMPRVRPTLPDASYRVPSFLGSDLMSTACGSSSLGLGAGVGASRLDPPAMPEASVPALDISSVEPTRMSTPLRFERSSFFTPAPEAEHRACQRSYGQGQAFAPLPQSSFCSYAARSSFATDTATSSSLSCMVPRAVSGSRGDPGLAPCARMERARAASNPPRLQLAGPSGRHRVHSTGRSAPRASNSINSNFGSKLGPERLCTDTSFREPWAPLPAPRGPVPQVWQRPSGADASSGSRNPRKGSESLELSGPPQLASPPRNPRSGSAGPLPVAQASAPLPLKDAAVQLEHGQLRAPEAQDEVICQSPKNPHTSQAFASEGQPTTTGSCEMAVQTDSVGTAAGFAKSHREEPQPITEPVSALHFPKTGVQTDCNVDRHAERRDEWVGDSGMGTWRSSLSHNGTARRGLAEQMLLSQDQLAGVGALGTPEKLRFSAIKGDTPDFGDVVSAQASSLWQGSFDASRPLPSCDISIERGEMLAPGLNGPSVAQAAHHGESFDSKSTDAVELERLNQQLLKALGRALSHLRQMQNLAAPSSWDRPHAV
ncbi:TTLL5 [Symbiodinium natans]|uniref:TTLL5 protein n=1 Tax=Symbiodinium natans TaxID=878477 RepID=A0A812QH61_9DINO|nr:TTLL5 [Symbiodinium natans]